MLQSINNIIGYTIAAKNGNIGVAQDFLFDDDRWRVRYLVVDTGDWLPGRKVLIPPEYLGRPLYEGKMFPIQLSKEGIEASPPLETDKPVSKQYEAELRKHYTTSGFGGGVPAVYDSTDETKEGDSHLRSAREVVGYHIGALDGDIGHVEDFIVATDAWVLRYLVGDTRNWLPGRKVLVSVRWIDSIDWAHNRMAIDLTRDRIEGSPEYDPSTPINREYEERLYDFYGRPAYWTEESQGVRR